MANLEISITDEAVHAVARKLGLFPAQEKPTAEFLDYGRRILQDFCQFPQPGPGIIITAEAAETAARLIGDYYPGEPVESSDMAYGQIVLTAALPYLNIAAAAAEKES